MERQHGSCVDRSAELKTIGDIAVASGQRWSWLVVKCNAESAACIANSRVSVGNIINEVCLVNRLVNLALPTLGAFIMTIKWVRFQRAVGCV